MYYLLYKHFKKNYIILFDGDWGLGIGDWVLGPIPNTQSLIPNPQSPFPFFFKNLKRILNQIY